MTANDMPTVPPPDRPQPSGSGPIGASAGEIPFGIDEVFFSRTDTRGRILAGNDVFQRVSQYSWAEMIERPHNIIRHPDMPRAVFHLLWERIRAGQPVGAYVKNRARDGRHYWVFAVVTPVEDGYLSVRLKPGSALFDAASALYAQIRAHELDSDCKPAESAKALADDLREAGFLDYAAFMAAALSGEIRNRDAALGRRAWLSLEHFGDLAESGAILLKTTSRMLDLIAAFRYTPGNLRIQAARIGDEGRAIGEISTNYGQISEAIVDNLRELHSAAGEVFASINDGLFLACTARLQQETASFFEREASEKGEAHASEALRLAPGDAAVRQAAHDIAVRVEQADWRHRRVRDVPLAPRLAQQRLGAEHRRRVVALRREQRRGRCLGGPTHRPGHGVRRSVPARQRS